MIDFLFGILTLGNLSAFIFPGILLGIILYIGSDFIPVVFAQYKVPTKILGIALVFVFTFTAGSHYASSKYELEQVKLEVTIAKLEAEAKDITSKVEIRYVDRVKTIEKVKVEYVTQIEQIITKVADDQCTVNNGFVRVFNSSIDGTLPGAPIESDAAPSQIKLSDISKVTTENNLTTEQIRTQLSGLQSWIQMQKDLHDKLK